jgi:GNAT superfamily N-acetyltransferase
MAVAVIDEYHGRGIGHLLLDALVDHAVPTASPQEPPPCSATTPRCSDCSRRWAPRLAVIPTTAPS